MIPLKKIKSVIFTEKGIKLEVESCEIYVLVDYTEIKSKNDYTLPGNSYEFPSRVYEQLPDGSNKVITWHPIIVFNLLKEFFTNTKIPFEIDTKSSIVPKGHSIRYLL